MVGSTVQSTLESLKKERDRIDGAIAALEAFLGGAVGGKKRRARKAPAAKAVDAPAGGRRGRGKRKNAPRGLLKAKMHQVLKGARKPLAPVELRNLVIKAGYPAKNEKTLYTAIFAAAKKDPMIKKTSEGFSLK